MDKIDKLAELLKRLNAGENPKNVKEEAQEFLASISSEELMVAEQRLVEAGLAPEDLRHLCSAHMEMLGDELSKMKARLKPGHVIHTFVTEHEIILGFLDEMETVNQAIQKLKKYDAQNPAFQKLSNLIDNLLGAEPHHQREEEALFPAVEERGLSGPPRIMRMEHVDLRRRKKELKELVSAVDKIAFKDFQKKTDPAVKLLIASLRDHIFKENNILYPAALQIIPEVEVWQQIKAKCDQIGYCSFTPKAA